MNDQQTEKCTSECQECHDHCQETLFNYCLVEGGELAEVKHVKLMTDCIQICQVAADFMIRDSELSHAVCRACAEICETCAKSCEDIGGEEMDKCAEICRNCAENCREMAK